MKQKMNDLVSVVDDDQFVGEAVTNLLRANGFRAASYTSAQAFLSSSDLGETVCLVVDLQMPGICGLKLQQHLTENGHAIPTIFITAENSRKIREEALTAGAVDYLAKPIEEVALLRAVQGVFNRSNTPSQNKALRAAGEKV